MTSAAGDEVERRAAAARAAVDGDDLVRMALELCAVPSPLGREHEAAETFARQLRERGLESRLDAVAEGRSSAVGVLEGSAPGPSLLFLGHLDTGLVEVTRSSPAPRVVDDEVVGVGVWNMKGATVAYVAAAAAVNRAGIELAGRVQIAGVAGAHDQTLVRTRLGGGDVEGYSIGTRHLLETGLMADLAVVGEPSSFRLIARHFGMTATRIDIVQTRPASAVVSDLAVFDWAERDAVDVASDVVAAVGAWRDGYRARARVGGVDPWVFASGIEGGAPWSPYPAASATVFVFAGVAPGEDPAGTLAEVAGLAAEIDRRSPDHTVRATPYFQETGPVVRPEEPLHRAISEAHAAVFGGPPRSVVVPWHSDASPAFEHGMSALNYGPPGRFETVGEGDAASLRESVRVDDLIDCARVYADLIVRVCSASA